MSQPSQSEAHLVVAAVRVLLHLKGRAPRPEEIAEFLEMAPAVLRLRLGALEGEGIVAVVESAFDTHVEIKDHRLIEGLPAVAEEGDLSEDLADFDRRKQEEAEKMGQLFADGDHEKKKSERLGKMEKELRNFGKKKPRNPFGDD